MKSISVSTEVFAKIWSERKNGEDSEDVILRRLLKCPSPGKKKGFFDFPSGFHAARFGVTFEEGFVITRRYKNVNYKAIVKNGRWFLENDGNFYDSLSDLSRAVGAKIENVWMNWFYMNKDKKLSPISDLRDPATIVKKSIGRKR